MRMDSGTGEKLNLRERLKEGRDTSRENGSFVDQDASQSQTQMDMSMYGIDGIDHMLAAGAQALKHPLVKRPFSPPIK